MATLVRYLKVPKYAHLVPLETGTCRNMERMMKKSENTMDEREKFCSQVAEMNYIAILQQDSWLLLVSKNSTGILLFNSTYIEQDISAAVSGEI